MIVTKAELKQTKKIWAWVCFVYFPPPPFLSGASEAIQDPAPPPSVRSSLHLGARSNLFRRSSETCDTCNTADPIFDAWRLVLTKQSKNEGELPRPQVETSEMTDLNQDNTNKSSSNSKPCFFCGPFLCCPTLQQQNQQWRRRRRRRKKIGRLAGWRHFDNLP